MENQSINETGADEQLERTLKTQRWLRESRKQLLTKGKVPFFNLKFCFSLRINFLLGSHSLIQPHAEYYNSL